MSGDPQWLARARLYIGTHEEPGLKTNPEIARMMKLVGASWEDDETPWCGTFIAAVMRESGIDPPLMPWRALQWGGWGEGLPQPMLGCVAVKRRYDARGRLVGGHVTMPVSRSADGARLMCLGGNQSDAVTIAPYRKNDFFTFRYPSSHTPAPLPTMPQIIARTELIKES